MMMSVSAAEAETQSAYVGAIRALALALDARDPYTAGHSERVSAISVAIGRQMHLPTTQLDVLRLGALLHDIGKIGISDDVLRKPAALTPGRVRADQAASRRSARASCARAVPRPHLPDRRAAPRAAGRPGLSARLDVERNAAARAHRARRRRLRRDDQRARLSAGARLGRRALRELWRCAGTQFDAEVVQSLVSALAVAGPGTLPALPALDQVTFAAPRRLALAGSSG